MKYNDSGGSHDVSNVRRVRLQNTSFTKDFQRINYFSPMQSQDKGAVRAALLPQQVVIAP